MGWKYALATAGIVLVLWAAFYALAAFVSVWLVLGIFVASMLLNAWLLDRPRRED